MGDLAVLGTAWFDRLSGLTGLGGWLNPRDDPPLAPVPEPEPELPAPVRLTWPRGAGIAVLVAPLPVSGSEDQRAVRALTGAITAGLRDGGLGVVQADLIRRDGDGQLLLRATGAPLTLAGLREALVGVLTHQREVAAGRPVTVVAVGFTGGVAARVADTDPGLMDGLVLVHPQLDYRRRLLGLDPRQLRREAQRIRFGADLRLEVADLPPGGWLPTDVTVPTLLVPGAADGVRPYETVPGTAEADTLARYLHACGGGCRVLDTLGYLDPLSPEWRRAVVSAISAHALGLTLTATHSP